MTLEEAEAAELAASDAVRTARGERDEAAAAHTDARKALAEAASRGLDAAREAQREIGKAEDRLRSAEELLGALEAVLRPRAATRNALFRIKRAEDLAAELRRHLAGRDSIDLEVISALERLAEAASRREAATAAALALLAAAEDEDLGPLGLSVERLYRAPGIAAAAATLPPLLRRAIAG
jgi:hypothetical protein